MTHRYLFQKPNDGSFYSTPTIVVIGAGGTGSQLLTGLSRMVVALQSLNMAVPEVIVCDPDTVSRANVGRQLFSPSDIGQSKAHTLVNRINQYFGLNWQSYHGKFTPEIAKSRVIYISCVDSRSARQEIYEAIKENASYWLDLGNNNHSGQAILGNSDFHKRSPSAKRKYCLLPTVADLFPEIMDASIAEDDDTPSCSLAEALVKQDLMVNQTVATHALELLWQLLRHGEIHYHGFFFDNRNFSLQPLPIDRDHWKRLMKQAKKYRKPVSAQAA